MQSDEEQIRQLVATWMTASKAGDVETVLMLLSDDAVFLMPGRPPMRRDEFAAAMRAQAGQASPKIDGSSEVQEIKVVGDWAFMWTALRIVATPPDGSPAIIRAGHTLSVLQKQNGKWLLARDANMLSSASPAGK